MASLVFYRSWSLSTAPPLIFTGKKKSSPSIFRRTQGGRGASRGPRWCKRQRKRTRRSRARGLLLAWPCPRCAHVAPTWHPVDIPRIAISLLLLVRFQKFLRQQDPLDALSLHCPCPPERKNRKVPARLAGAGAGEVSPPLGRISATEGPIGKPIAPLRVKTSTGIDWDRFGASRKGSDP